MKQLRPVINRIIKKIPDKDMEQVLGYLGSMFPKEAFPEIVPTLTATMKREQEYEKKLLADDKPVPPAPPNGGTTTEENSLPM